MDVDLRERFEASFRSEPPMRPADELVDAGRRALRRRRTVTAAAVGIAACALAIGAATQVGGHPSSLQPIHRPTEETGAEVEARLTRSTPLDTAWRPTCAHAARPYCETLPYALGAAPVAVRADGTLVRISGDVIIARRAVDATPPPGTRRYEVEVRTPESIHSRWYVVSQDASGRVLVEQAEPTASRVDFDTWASTVNSGLEPASTRTAVRVRVRD